MHDRQCQCQQCGGTPIAAALSLQERARQERTTRRVPRWLLITSALCATASLSMGIGHITAQHAPSALERNVRAARTAQNDYCQETGRTGYVVVTYTTAGDAEVNGGCE